MKQAISDAEYQRAVDRRKKNGKHATATTAKRTTRRKHVHVCRRCGMERCQCRPGDGLMGRMSESDARDGAQLGHWN